jgi:lysophospholipase L1-like esterase
MKPATRALRLLALLLPAVLVPQLRAQAPATTAVPDWVEPMKKVHARFRGEQGTLSLFGDSITVSLAFWAPLQDDPKNMNKEMKENLKLVKGYMKPEGWRGRGAENGNEGGMTIRWADENVVRWLKRLNPEAAVILFGTNDLGQLDVKEYEAKTRRVVERCLKNGTIVLLTTPPPRHGLLEKSRQFADAVRRVAKAMHVPVVDYSAAILERRPDDWDGALPQFKRDGADEYQVPTLIAGDGVHPSYPAKYRDFSQKSLKKNGYALRSYVTLRAYADVIDKVLQPHGSRGKK